MLSEFQTLRHTAKPVATLKKLIEVFTDPGDVVIDPTAGSGSTLYAARELNRPSFGFECNTAFYRKASEWLTTTAKMDKHDYTA